MICLEWIGILNVIWKIFGGFWTKLSCNMKVKSLERGAFQMLCVEVKLYPKLYLFIHIYLYLLNILCLFPFTLNSTFKQWVHYLHGSYNLEKVLNFTQVVMKSPWIRFRSSIEKYLICLLGLKKSLKFRTLSMPETFFCKIRLFCLGKFGMNNILFVFPYIFK